VSGGDNEATLDVENYLANLGRRANAYLGSKDFLKGIAVFRAVIILADAEKRTDEAVAARFRLAEIYIMYGHAQAAADELKMAATAYPGHKEHGKAVIMRLKHLYDAKLYDRILEEIPDALADKAAAEYRPQFLYLGWLTNRHQGKQEASEEFQKQFIRDYPNHPFCADMLFASATSLMAAGEYADAERLLEMITEKYSNRLIAAKSRENLTKIQENRRKMSESAAAKPMGD